MLCSIAKNIDDTTMQSIKALEKDLGKTLLAFSCHNLKTSQLSGEEIKKIENVEKKLGVALVAVDQ